MNQLINPVRLATRPHLELGLGAVQRLWRSELKLLLVHELILLENLAISEGFLYGFLLSQVR